MLFIVLLVSEILQSNDTNMNGGVTTTSKSNGSNNAVVFIFNLISSRAQTSLPSWVKARFMRRTPNICNVFYSIGRRIDESLLHLKQSRQPRGCDGRGLLSDVLCFHLLFCPSCSILKLLTLRLMFLFPIQSPQIVNNKW